MPTYLTPGVYVEEIPSSNKPIEGVGTAVAAFVGLAPGGPINTPMRISNWTQFAKIYGDPVNPDNGPFMDGSYLAHSVYGFFQNGGSLCWIVRVGKEGAGARPRAALPAATDKTVEAFRAEALPGVEDPVTIELSEEPGTGAPRRTARRRTSSSSRPASSVEEHEGLTLKKGRANVATKVNARVEARQARGGRRGAARDARGDRVLHALGAGASHRRRSARPSSRATSPSAPAWAVSPRSTRSRCS